MTRRLIVCPDGTWNTPEKKGPGAFGPSNLVETARAAVQLAAGRRNVPLQPTGNRHAGERASGRRARGENYHEIPRRHLDTGASW